MWPAEIVPMLPGAAGSCSSEAGTVSSGEPSPQLIVAVSVSGAALSVKTVWLGMNTAPAPTVWSGPAVTVTVGAPTMTWNDPEPCTPSLSKTVTVTV